MSVEKNSTRQPDTLRNTGIIAHIDAGKTTLTERLLYYTGRIHRMGEVHEGTATMDFMPEEQQRGITIASACTTCEWKKHTLNIIDTPGHVDFTMEVQRCLRVLDGAVGIFCAVGGVEPQSETVWRQSEQYQVPKLVFVNKMDRPGADFSAVLDGLSTRLHARPVPLQVPVGSGPDFEGLIDLIQMQRLCFAPSEPEAGVEYTALTAREQELASPWQERMLETLAEVDDIFCEKYLESSVSAEDIHGAVRRATLSLALVPAFAGSALKNIGIEPVLDAIVAYLPGPREVPAQQGIHPLTRKTSPIDPDPKKPLCALAFKVAMDQGRKQVLLRIYSGTLQAGQTVYNATRDKEERTARLFILHAGRREKTQKAFPGQLVAVAGMKHARTGDTLTQPDSPVLLEDIRAYKPVLCVALEPANSTEADKLDEVLEKFLLEDPTLLLTKEEETGQLLLSGMGELHLEIVQDRLRREYNLSPRVGRPHVVYQETISKEAVGQGEFRRELAEQEQYGYIEVALAPLPRGSGQQIRSALPEETWPALWQKAAVAGLTDALQSGILKGCPVHDIAVTITAMRRMDSSTPIGYHMAAVAALRDALRRAGSLLLEPLMAVQISTPEQYTGEVVSLLGERKARIEAMEDSTGQKTIQALAPLAALFGFSTDLRSATQGRAGMLMHFARFDTLE